MPRIADSEIERIKREINLEALVRSKGIELSKHGSKDLAGLSPFTDEKTASFIVTPSKNLWHCMSSGKGGSVIDFVMAYEGVSFRHAFEILTSGKTDAILQSGARKKQSRVRKLENPLASSAEDGELLQQVLSYYEERLWQTPSALAYLQKRGIADESALKKFRIGFADRTLGLRLPEKTRKAGDEIRSRLSELGIYRQTGHEHFNGCLVFPILNEQGEVAEMYGRRIGSQKTGIYHMYLPGPHQGIWNPDCLKSPEIILTESVIDALTFWVNGMKNVTCIYGTEGFSDELLQALRKHQTQKIYLAYDRDQAGDRAAARDAEKLASYGMECYRVLFPPGMDVNEYALKVTPASTKHGSAKMAQPGALAEGEVNGCPLGNEPSKSLQTLLSGAVWCESNHKSLAKSSEDKKSDSIQNNDTNVSSNKELAAKLVASNATKGKNSAPSAETELIAVNEDYILNLPNRSYRIRGLHKNTSFEVLKVNVRLMVDERFYLDTLDFYRAKERSAFIVAASSEVQLEADLVKRDIGKLLLALEELQDKSLREELESSPEEVVMEEAERQAAVELLQSPNLLERILSDFAACGIVGEATNKLTGYLAAVSRKLDKPLAIIVQSTSAAGKTALMESVLCMMPPEEKVKYSAMTGQSLYYLGETNLKNKILAIVEEEGAEKASYALKLLQSEGELTIASTGKDEQGRMKTEEYHVEGPVMIFLTTTAVDIDEELLNRCLVLSVDESREQTKAIHDLQREAETFDGLQRKMQREQILQVHQNAQRLLQPLHVVNPFAKQLTFLSDRTRTRRDHMKYLTLIRTITLLHQHQRPKKQQGDLEYIEVTKEDIASANRLAHEVLGRSLDELPPQTRRLLFLLKQMITQECERKGVATSDYLFTRREVRDFTGWSNTQLKIHLDRLEDLEYILPHRGSRGTAYAYELLFDGDIASEKPQLIGLIDPEKLKYDGKFAGQSEEFAPLKRGQNGGITESRLTGKASVQAGKQESYPKTPNAQEALQSVTVVS